MKINLDKIKETTNISIGAFILSMKSAIIYSYKYDLSGSVLYIRDKN